jgi:hypothetical protein
VRTAEKPFTAAQMVLGQREVPFGSRYVGSLAECWLDARRVKPARQRLGKRRPFSEASEGWILPLEAVQPLPIEKQVCSITTTINVCFRASNPPESFISVTMSVRYPFGQNCRSFTKPSSASLIFMR